MAAPARENVITEESGGGGSSSNKDHDCDNAVSVVIERDNISDEFLRSIMYGGGDNTMRKHKIQKVPKVLRQMEEPNKKKYYDPEVVSIGPYHRQKELNSLEEFKTEFTREYVKSCEPHYSINGLYSKVKEVTGEARMCYAQGSTEDIDDSAFAQMMFLDGCFVLQYIYYACMEDKAEQAKTKMKSHDIAEQAKMKMKQAKMKMKNHDIAFVRRDLFLLENQLPFKVLQVLMCMSSRFDKGKGLNFIKEFIRNMRAIPLEAAESGNAESNSQDEPAAHLLELMHRQLIHPNNKGGSSSRSYPLMMRLFNFLSCKKQGFNNSWYSYRSVQELKAAGIKFKPNKTTSPLTDVRYEPLIIKAILRLPPMTIDDLTQALLLNLVAYEMCPDTPNDFGVTSYIWFMDTLIDEAGDVKELRKKGILLNYLGSDQEVAGLFNEMAKNLVPNPRAYEDVKNQIESHYKNRVILWMTEWLHTHFSSPWTALALFGALLVIGLSIVQTYFAVNPKDNSGGNSTNCRN